MNGEHQTWTEPNLSNPPVLVSGLITLTFLLASCGDGTSVPLGLTASANTPVPSASTGEPDPHSVDLDEGAPLNVEDADEITGTEVLPQKFELSTTSSNFMSEEQYLALPAYDITLGSTEPALRECAASSRLQDRNGDWAACTFSIRSVNGIEVPVVEVCGYVRGSSRLGAPSCRVFASARTQRSDGRWDGGDGSRRWSLSLDSAPNVSLMGRVSVVEIDPVSGRELRPVCGVFLDSGMKSGSTTCSADTLRPAANSRAWKILMPGGQVSSGLSVLEINSPAAIVRERGGTVTVTEVSQGLQARAESGQVVLGAAPFREWEAAPNLVTQPFIELVIDARSTDVTSEGRLLDEMALVAPNGCPETFRVLAGERTVLCRVPDMDRVGLFQVNFPEFVVSKGGMSRDFPASVYRMGAEAPLRLHSDAASISIERVGSVGYRAVIVPKRSNELGLVAQDPNRVTGTLVIDTSAWSQTYVGFINANVQDGNRFVEECQGASIERPQAGEYPLCSFPMRPGRIDQGFGIDTRRIGLRAVVYSSAQQINRVQEISFSLVFMTGVPRSEAVLVQNTRKFANGLEVPTVTWTGANTFTVTVTAKAP